MNSCLKIYLQKYLEVINDKNIADRYEIVTESGEKNLTERAEQNVGVTENEKRSLYEGI